MQKVLLTSGTGFFSSTWCLDTNHKFQNHTLSRSKKKFFYKNYKINFSNTKNIIKIVNKVNPDIILHTAAITDVDLCEEKPSLSKKINFNLTKKISDICKKKKIKLIFISSDQVFSKKKNNLESSRTSPINVYSLHKSMSENYIAKNLHEYLIIRTNFFGISPKVKKSFINFITFNLLNKNKINLITDIIHNPISIHHLITYIIRLHKLDVNGIFHISSDEKISKYDLGIKIAKIFGLNISLINKCKISNIKFKAQRPNYMYLNNKKLKKILKIRIPSIQAQIKDIKKNYTKNYYNKILLIK